jgi:hypothetical protein
VTPSRPYATFPRMVFKRLKHLITPDAQKLMLRGILETFGAMWLVMEPSVYFFDNYVKPWRSHIIACTSAVAVAVGLWRAFPRRAYARRFAKRNLTLEVTVGDLLGELESGRSNIVVAINNRLTPYANRTLGRSIRSAVAAKYFNGRWDLLDRAILAQLSSVATAVPGASNVYEVPLGSVAWLEVGGQKIFLLVNQRAGDTGSASVTKEDYWNCLGALWSYMSRAGNNYPLAVPILGSGSGRVAADRVSLMQLILISFLMTSRLAPVTRRLSVVIRDDDYDPVEMQEMALFLKSLVF